MAVICIGSINIDLVYHVPHLVRPGETLAATDVTRGLGGKGANQSIAAAKAGADVTHCGAVGSDGADMVDAIAAAGVDTGLVEVVKAQTGHAVIEVDPSGENAIILFPGANMEIGSNQLDQAIDRIGPSDWAMLQNEVSVTAEAARLARAKGARVVYSAAPFDADAVLECLPHITHLLLNEVENAELEALGSNPSTDVIRVVTKGSAGATWIAPGEKELHVPAFLVETVVDTTGAGDCFAGNLVAALQRGEATAAAMTFAQAAAAIQITRPGAASAMPTLAETEAFLGKI